MLNPLRSEAEAFKFLLWAAVALLVLVLVGLLLEKLL